MATNIALPVAHDIFLLVWLEPGFKHNSFVCDLKDHLSSVVTWDQAAYRGAALVGEPVRRAAAGRSGTGRRPAVDASHQAEPSHLRSAGSA
jgi:hypothetical protein